MNKEKQIEEMARIMTKFDGRLCERLPNSCLLSKYTHAQINCNFCKTAEDIYNAGYRKQSEGENITENHPVDEFICSECGFITRDCCRYEIDEDDGDEICYEFAFKFCPRCGAKMKGEEHEN